VRLRGSTPSSVHDEVREWQGRPLDPVYPVVFFDALRVKIRDEGLVKKKPSTWRSPSLRTARRMCSGCGSRRARGPSSGLKVVNELKARGVNDILAAVVDALKGFPEAIASVYPQTLHRT
jgi:putative transposase